MKINLHSGLLFVIVGLIFAIWSTTYDVGTASNMGPGYFPLILGLILVILGLLNVLKSMVVKEVNTPANIAWRPLILILLANILFGVLLPLTGLIVATFALVIVSSFAMPNTQIKEILILSTVLSAIGYCVFALVLSMPIRIFPPI